jgi:hypothetical protein
VRQYQVVHDPAGLQVRVALRERAPADTPARVREALARELRDAGAVPPPIQPRAKFKLVRSTVPRG